MAHTLVNFYRTEEFLNAVRKSISLRLKNGGGHTGWSNAWLINLFAILGDSQQAYQHIQHAILEASYSNLWSKHPPFQIDGNFGVAAGIANLFIQDRNGHVKWLPSLPAELKDGFVKGLKIKGNQTVEDAVENGELIRKIFIKSFATKVCNKIKKTGLCHKSPPSNAIRTLIIIAPAVQGLLVAKVRRNQA